MLTTLGQAKKSSLKAVAGACPSSDDFIGLVNEATRRLMRRGDWAGTVVPIYLCVRSGCVVFPRYVGQVRKINLCNQNVSVTNMWGDFLQYESPAWRTGNEWWGDNSFGRWLGSPAQMVQSSRTPLFQDIMGDGRYVRAYPTARKDVGKEVTIFGVDNNGQTLRTRDSTDDTWSDGWVLTLASPYVSTSAYVRRIDRVLLPDDLQGDVRLYAYNAAGLVLEELATYEPGDENPAFEKYVLHGSACGQCSCDNATGAVALVKLKYVPAKTDKDLVLIENLDALKFMIQCIKAEEASTRDDARQWELDAIRELNLDLRDQMPEDQTPVSNNPFSGISAGRQKVF